VGILLSEGMDHALKSFDLLVSSFQNVLEFVLFSDCLKGSNKKSVIHIKPASVVLDSP
jgi:hypothetical protein